MGTPQGQGIVPRDGPRAQPVVPGFFSDVGKVQIEPFPLLQSIPHLCTCTSPQNLVWGITVPPKKLCQKPSVGQDPPPSQIYCVRSSGTGWAASLFTMQKTASSIKENKRNGQKVGLSSPHSPFPNGNTKKEENPEQSAVWIRESKQERKEEHSHSSQKVTLGAPCS